MSLGGGGGSVNWSVQLSVDRSVGGSMDRGSVFWGHPFNFNHHAQIILSLLG